MNRELEIRERVAQYGMALLGADRVEMDVTRDNLEFYAYSDLRYLLDETDRLTADLAAMTAKRDALRERAEAAERDMRHAISMSPYAICGLFCKNHKPGCSGVNCRPEWCGPDGREGI